MATNVKYEVKGDLLTITVDVSKATRDAAQPSSTLFSTFPAARLQK